LVVAIDGSTGIIEFGSVGQAKEREKRRWNAHNFAAPSGIDRELEGKNACNQVDVNAHINRVPTAKRHSKEHNSVNC
jgi:hypothetical protein